MLPYYVAQMLLKDNMLMVLGGVHGAAVAAVAVGCCATSIVLNSEG